MDTIIHAAIEEICSQGVNGVSLSLLWPRLHSSLSSAEINLCPAVKRAVWSSLAAVPGLQFRDVNGSELPDPKSKSVEECESLGVKVVANEQLRGCFVGLYDVKASNITAPQQRVLERLALARETGVTQVQLSKDLGIPGNNIFYVVKRLQSWGLVVRQETIVRTKENRQPVRTNLIHLHRYALPLSSQQRLEITKENKNLEENHVSGADLEECGQDDVRVKDFLPAIKAVCDRLEQAEGKVLVVSDIKQELGYRETKGHRAWRNISNRLKQAGLVEVFEAKVDSKVETPTKSKKGRSRGQNKPVSCLRLLKSFSPKYFQQKNRDGKYIASEQLVELPFEQQIYDMIDIEGSKGLLGVDVCGRLGISTKMLDNLTNTMVSRFGLHQLSENLERGLAYRFWTKGNFCPELPNSSFNRLQDGSDGHPLALASIQEPTHGTSSQRTIADMDSLNSKKWLTEDNMEKIDTEEELEHESQQVRGSVQIVACPGGSLGLVLDMSNIPGSAGGNECNGTTEALANPVIKPFELQEGQRYPSLTNAQREIRLLERLETEKIIVKPELQRWLESFEKDKKTRMDRKTLTHCLNKLEREGKCKLMVFSIPGVSNCGHLRQILVVLHPSVQGSASELSDQVHDRLRSFEMQTRGALSQSKKELPIPVLHGIERIQINAHSDTQSAKSEVMRANGFVLAKMVRTKLLHRFLWDYVNSSAACTEESTSTKSVNPTKNSSCVLFGLDVAIKAMPFELFLQVVGSPLTWTDMIEKCKTGLLLSDLSDEEFKSMMDTRATGRLSWLIDILRRLKLIRLVADESPTDATKISHAKLIYALELKPYIEEPLSMDLLPRGPRHDFVLSTGEAVEKYWQTLEYCYAAADTKAAIRAFPGCVVFEVCLYRSWTTVRVMKAEQRAELLKRIKDQQSKKLSFQECREIAKDLNLSLEQVLRVYYDNRQQRLNRFQGDFNIQGVVSDARSDRHPQSRRKRKVSEEERLAKRAKANHTSESHEDSEEEELEEPEVVEHEEQQESLIGQCIMPMLKPTRQQKFSWTEEADRLLLIQYARQRAIQGARRGTDWASISDLPAPPNTCRRRVSVLRRDIKFAESLMRLCKLLTQRYAQQLDQEKNEYGQESHSQGKRWDDFDDSTIKVALKEVLVQKQMMKLESAKRSESASQGAHNIVASSPGEFDNDSEKQQIDSSQRSRRHRLPQKFVMHLKEGVSIIKRMNQSLAVSCAVELFKLVFLTNSKAAEMPNLLAETLCCYSEHDLFSAFDYLRQKKILVGSGPSQPFVLSQNFLRSLSLSQFPANTGKRASKLARWISEKEKKLMEGMVDLPSDLQCGDVFHLFALISSGELSIMPVLPLEGVGEAEDSRSTKRKYDDHEFEESGVSKKHKCNSLQESEIFSRREKGFPGIKVSLSRATILRSNTVEFFKDEGNAMLFSENDQFYSTLGQTVSCTLSSIESVKESPDFGSIIPATIISGNSLWEVMANFSVQDLSKHSGQEYAQLHPELFKIAHTNIQKAGDQGLTMSKVSECLGIQGTILAEHVVDVLQLFGLVLKVNGYNSIHVVDGQYLTKYFLASKTTYSQGPGMASSSVTQRDETHIVEGTADCEDKVNYSDDCEVHSRNASEEVSPLFNVVQAHKKLEGSSSRTSTEDRENIQNFDKSTAAFRPILPWINGDGTINRIVYRGLTRRILGIVTQNPAILEGDILSQMEVLNPQSCRKLLELMVLDKHLIVRKMTQRTSSTPPALLEILSGSYSRPKFVCRQHYFANPMSTSLL
ncbi:uncharacterized protein LOC110716442 isoform X1 [Chenopodium quinoa]|uniref:uncharacterized protein LOC110716442 isoform X1 n=1 Tax=Chenopodium quinoa TaxID=63459 RepID=UPI000B788E9D|nr:uncharacterized protein LOC110716442 isoform X1 [Chenopodium quinoa]